MIELPLHLNKVVRSIATIYGNEIRIEAPKLCSDGTDHSKDFVITKGHKGELIPPYLPPST